MVGQFIESLFIVLFQTHHNPSRNVPPKSPNNVPGLFGGPLTHQVIRPSDNPLVVHSKMPRTLLVLSFHFKGGNHRFVVDL